MYLFTNVTSVSTLEWLWNDMRWGAKDNEGYVIDQASFCSGVAANEQTRVAQVGERSETVRVG